jgi:RNA polymerase sigma-70 factor (ECF subfamily)
VSNSALKREPRLRVVQGEGAGRPSAADDAALIDAFERGDLETAQRLYDRLERVVGATLVKVLGEHGQDHDDLVQSAFEQILITLARKKFARACSLSSWAVSVTTHVALNAIRKRQHERRNVEVDSAASDAGPSAGPGPEQAALLRTLREELGKLSPMTARVLVMHEVMGHDLAEIAVLTGLSVSAAQSRLVRGRAELRRRLDSQFPEARS